MNHPSGLGPAAVLVYRLRVSHPTDTVEELAVRAELTAAEVDEAQKELTALGLLIASPAGGWAAISPEDATEELVASTEQEILRWQIGIATVRARMHALSGHYLEARSLRSARGDIELVRGLENIRAVIEDLSRTATTGVDVVATGGGQSEQALRAALPSDLRVLSRGCALRVLFQDSARRHKPTESYVRELEAAGGRVRCVGSLPTRMIVFDRETAVLPLDPQRTSSGVAVVRDPAVLGFIRTLYAHLWYQGTEFTTSRDPDHPELSREERGILVLMAQGRTNPAISRELGVSPRTVARIVADLMARLGADSRFQAGVRAVRQGWLE